MHERAALAVLLSFAISCTETRALDPGDGSGGGDDGVVARTDLRVLFIGNSLTQANALPEVLEMLAASPGSQVSVQHDQSTPGGYFLDQHAVRASTVDKISQGDWDYVVLQEQSGGLYDASRAAARQLHTLIGNNGGETVLFQTWFDDTFNLTKYEALSSELDATLAPVGRVWQTWSARSGVSPRSTNGNASYVLPVLTADGVHPNANGTYLAALTFLGLFSTELPASPNDGGLGLTPAQIDEARSIVADTLVVEGGRPVELLLRAPLNQASLASDGSTFHFRDEANGFDLEAFGGIESDLTVGPTGAPQSALEFSPDQWLTTLLSDWLRYAQTLRVSFDLHRTDWGTLTANPNEVIVRLEDHFITLSGTTVSFAMRFGSTVETVSFDAAALSGWQHFAFTYEQDQLAIEHGGNRVAVRDVAPASMPFASDSVCLNLGVEISCYLTFDPVLGLIEPDPTPNTQFHGSLARFELRRSFVR